MKFRIFAVLCLIALAGTLFCAVGCGETFPFDYSGLSDAEILLSDCQQFSIGDKTVAVACVGTKNDDDQRVTAAKMGMAMEDYAAEKHIDAVYTILKNYHTDAVELLFYGAGTADTVTALFGKPDGFRLPLAGEIDREELVGKLRSVMEKQ